jgi:hypothetical protein
MQEATMANGVNPIAGTTVVSRAITPIRYEQPSAKAREDVALAFGVQRQAGNSGPKDYAPKGGFAPQPAASSVGGSISLNGGVA